MVQSVICTHSIQIFTLMLTFRHRSIKLSTFIGAQLVPVGISTILTIHIINNYIGIPILIYHLLRFGH